MSMNITTMSGYGVYRILKNLTVTQVLNGYKKMNFSEEEIASIFGNPEDEGYSELATMYISECDTDGEILRTLFNKIAEKHGITNIWFAAGVSDDEIPYLIYEPSYPWNISEDERDLDMEDLYDIFLEFLDILEISYNREDFDVDYQEVPFCS